MNRKAFSCLFLLLLTFWLGSLYCHLDQADQASFFSPLSPLSLAIAGDAEVPATHDGADGEDGWVGSAVCQSCHRGRYASWHRSFHRSMTQEAQAETVLGRFDGSPQDYWGGVIRPVYRDGRYYFQYYRSGSDEQLAEYEVTRVVGSHRYQQYLAKTPNTAGTYYRLHLLWHIEDQRWVHMNGVFLGPDNQHFDAQVSVWNQNCIFCHNTGPRPGILNLNELNLRAARGEQVDSATQSIFESEVAELGISCETCHGPGAQHVARNRNPLRRLWAQLRGSDDSIVHPNQLPQERALQVCGQCHGQRVAKDTQEVFRWVQDGPSYRAGGDLFESVELVAPDTKIPGDSVHDRFARRFWGDATPRLTAYEYQGVNMSACVGDQNFTCASCHSMHRGDPAGMLRPAHDQNKAADAPCSSCHQAIAAAPAEHSRHAPDTAGSECVNCHMPRQVYGVMSIHRSHHIETPDPAAQARAGRPNACNQCHMDRSLRWADQQRRRLWPESGLAAADASTPDLQRADGADTGLPAGLAELYAGDPVQRAVAAEGLGFALSAGGQRAVDWIPHLFAAMTDNYPAVRRFAAQSLKQALNQLGPEGEALAEPLARFDFIAAPAARNLNLAQMLAAWSRIVADWPPAQRPELLLTPQYLPDERVDDLQALGYRRSDEISIGE